MNDLLARVARRAVVISAVFTAVALLMGGLPAAVGVLGGATLALMSFLLLRRGIRGLAEPGAPAQRRDRAVALILLRYALLAFAAYVMIARLRLHPLGLLIGASSIAVAVTAEALLEARR